MADRDLDRLLDHLCALTDEQLLEVLRAALDDSVSSALPHETPDVTVTGRSRRAPRQ